MQSIRNIGNKKFLTMLAVRLTNKKYSSNIFVARQTFAPLLYHSSDGYNRFETFRAGHVIKHSEFRIANFKIDRVLKRLVFIIRH